LDRTGEDGEHLVRSLFLLADTNFSVAVVWLGHLGQTVLSVDVIDAPINGNGTFKTLLLATVSFWLLKSI
jgi:hypothetical protein